MKTDINILHEVLANRIQQYIIVIHYYTKKIQHDQKG